MIDIHELQRYKVWTKTKYSLEFQVLVYRLKCILSKFAKDSANPQYLRLLLYPNWAFIWVTK